MLLINVRVLCRHMCMVMRGVQKTQSRTVTSMMVGVFALDHGSTSSRLTIVHSLDKHDGRRLYIGPRVNLLPADNCPLARQI